MPSFHYDERLSAMSPSSHKAELRDWLILAEDGRHVLLGRHSHPTEEDISRVAHALTAQGMGGWLVSGIGKYYEKGQPYKVQNIREIVESNVPWEISETLFYKIRGNL